MTSMKAKSLWYPSFMALCLWGGACLAQGDDVDFSDMSLEDLLKVEVSVASTKAETIIETPAVVSRYEARDLQAMGVRDLKGILSFIPGFVVQESTLGTSPVMIRGIVEGFNQKILFLIDGVPYWQPTHGEIGLLAVPVEAISRVEVIRGPGAVIYGTNASGGVINVVTKKAAKSVVAASTGSNSMTDFGAYLNYSFNENAHISISGQFLDDDGYESQHIKMSTFIPGYANNPVTPNGSLNKFDQVDSLMANFRYKNFNATLQDYEHVGNGYAGFQTVRNEADLQYEGSLLAMSYLFDWEKVDLTVFADHNNFVRFRQACV